MFGFSGGNGEIYIHHLVAGLRDEMEWTRQLYIRLIYKHFQPDS